MSEPLWTEEDRGFNSPCWIWQKYKMQLGYGIRWDPREQRKVVAHRSIYQELVGPIPEGMTLDHLCRTRDCVNPEHMEIVTLRENILRGTSPAAENATKTHCPQGHEYTRENTYLTAEGRRRCRECLRVQRGSVLPAAAERTHCPHGHEYDAANTGRTRRGHRYCRTCNRARARRNNEKRKSNV